MKNGTYQEALNAGFSVDRAEFLSRMCIDTKDEMQKRMEDNFHLRKKYTAKEKDERLKTVFLCIGIGVSCVVAVALILTTINYAFDWMGTIIDASLGRR
jgi:hypothetical protein